MEIRTRLREREKEKEKRKKKKKVTKEKEERKDKKKKRKRTAPYPPKGGVEINLDHTYRVRAYACVKYLLTEQYFIQSDESRLKQLEKLGVWTTTLSTP